MSNLKKKPRIKITAFDKKENMLSPKTNIAQGSASIASKFRSRKRLRGRKSGQRKPQQIERNEILLCQQTIEK